MLIAYLLPTRLRSNCIIGMVKLVVDGLALNLNEFVHNILIGASKISNILIGANEGNRDITLLVHV